MSTNRPAYNLNDAANIELARHFEVIGILGKGHFGEVRLVNYDGWLAKDNPLHAILTQMGNPIALKIVPYFDKNGKPHSPEARDRELEALKYEGRQMAHFMQSLLTKNLQEVDTNIAYGFGAKFNGEPVVISKIYPSEIRGNLEDLIKSVPANLRQRKGQFAEMAEKIAYDIQQGLNELHAKKLLHLDISARNCVAIVNGKQTSAKIIDFGFARLGPREGYPRVYERINNNANVRLQVEVENPKDAFPIKISPIERLRYGRVEPTADLFAARCLVLHLIAGISGYPEIYSRIISADYRMLPNPNEPPEAHGNWILNELYEGRLTTNDQLLQHYYNNAEALINDLPRNSSGAKDAKLFLQCFREFLTCVDGLPTEKSLELYEKCRKDWAQKHLQSQMPRQAARSAVKRPLPTPPTTVQSQITQVSAPQKNSVPAASVKIGARRPLPAIPSQPAVDSSAYAKPIPLRDSSMQQKPVAAPQQTEHGGHYQVLTPKPLAKRDQQTKNSDELIQRQLSTSRKSTDEYSHFRPIGAQEDFVPPTRPRSGAITKDIKAIKNEIKVTHQALHERLNHIKSFAAYPNYSSYKAIVQDIANYGLKQNKDDKGKMRSGLVLAFLNTMAANTNEPKLITDIAQFIQSNPDLHVHRNKKNNETNTTLVKKLQHMQKTIEKAYPLLANEVGREPSQFFKSIRASGSLRIKQMVGLANEVADKVANKFGSKRVK